MLTVLTVRTFLGKVLKVLCSLVVTILIYIGMCDILMGAYTVGGFLGLIGTATLMYAVRIKLHKKD